MRRWIAWEGVLMARLASLTAIAACMCPLSSGYAADEQTPEGNDAGPAITEFLARVERPRPPRCAP